MAYTANSASATLAELKDIYEAAYQVVTVLQPFHQGTNAPLGTYAGKEAATETNAKFEALHDALVAAGSET